MKKLSEELNELEKEQEELKNRSYEISKRIREINIQVTKEEKGDILKDKWFYTNGFVFHSFGSLDDTQAYDNRVELESMNNCCTPFFNLRFKGIGIFVDNNGKFQIEENINLMNNHKIDYISIIVNPSQLKFLSKKECMNILEMKIKDRLNLNFEELYLRSGRNVKLNFGLPKIDLIIK